MTGTVLDRLIAALREAAAFNRHDLAGPVVVLWPDGDRVWEPALQSLATAVPELMLLEDQPSAENRGPSTWLRYAVSRQELSSTPIVYLPGVSRASFRSAVAFPESARHLFAWQFQGQFWAQTNGKDWTPSAFLSSQSGGLGLDLAGDKATQQAVRDQLVHLLQTPSSQLEGRTIDAILLHGLVARDPQRMLLEWIADPQRTRAEWTTQQWKGFVTLCRQRFDLDPEKDGNIEAAERLASGKGEWEEVWIRFEQAPTAYLGMRDILARVEPRNLLDKENDRLPANNLEQESLLRSGLLQTVSFEKGEAQAKLTALCKDHTRRAASVWAALGDAPLALAAVHLAVLAEVVSVNPAPVDWTALSDYYTTSGWRADAAAWKALAAVRDNRDVQAVSAALRATYLPWLEDLAERCGRLASSYPNRSTDSARVHSPTAGTVIVFVDGLRWDLAPELLDRLNNEQLEGAIEANWAPLPTVTATAKSAWMPFAEHAHGAEVSATFEPRLRDGNRPIRAPEFRGVLEELNWQYLPSSSLGEPTGIAWTEAGSIDRYGHDDSSMFPRRINQELQAVCTRVRDLVSAGWKEVVITTDHGWLFMPGGLPKVDLPKHLTVSRWGRCAVPQAGAKHAFPQVPWFWGGEHIIVLAPGVSVFRGGTEYAHGGLTLQECVIPTFTLRASGASEKAPMRIESAKWVGLRLQIQLSGGDTPVQLDLRTHPAAAESSILSEGQRLKSPDSSGKVSLTVEDDDRLGQAAVVVVLMGEQVVAKQAVIVGGS